VNDGAALAGFLPHACAGERAAPHGVLSLSRSGTRKYDEVMDHQEQQQQQALAL
jgi:hypothetical protein